MNTIATAWNKYQENCIATGDDHMLAKDSFYAGAASTISLIMKTPEIHVFDDLHKECVAHAEDRPSRTH